MGRSTEEDYAKETVGLAQVARAGDVPARRRKRTSDVRSLKRKSVFFFHSQRQDSERAEAEGINQRAILWGEVKKMNGWNCDAIFTLQPSRPNRGGRKFSLRSHLSPRRLPHQLTSIWPSSSSPMLA